MSPVKIIVWDGDSCLFDGTVKQFQNTFFDNFSEEEAEQWAKTHNYSLEFHYQAEVNYTVLYRGPKFTAHVEESKYMWEILVPTQMLNINDQMRAIKTRYHRVWDSKVREITGGLTIMSAAKGHWISPDKELFVEKMIPVRIVATRPQIDKIADMTAKYYRQEAVLFYKISNEVEIKHYGKLPHPHTPK